MDDRLAGPLADPAADAGYTDHPERVGFFTDTSVCIGCKACEVACKEWNLVPEDGPLDLLGTSYDNTGALGASTWRHVAFIEQRKPAGGAPVDLGMPGLGPSGSGSEDSLPRAGEPDPTPTGTATSTGTGTATSTGTGTATSTGTGTAILMGTGGLSTTDLSGDRGQASQDDGLRWLMASDVCKHCTHAACLDVCPTGSLFRTEYGTVVVQADICNGCGYCVPACPYGVIDLRPEDGRAFKCTLCYDRLGDGLEPACAKACPTDSIQFGPLDELRERADRRLAELQNLGVDTARLYGRDPKDGVGGDGAFFLLLDEPEVYGLPPDPVVTTRDLPEMWRYAALAAVGVAVGVALSFAGPVDGRSAGSGIGSGIGSRAGSRAGPRVASWVSRATPTSRTVPAARAATTVSATTVSGAGAAAGAATPAAVAATVAAMSGVVAAAFSVGRSLLGRRG